MKWNNITIYQLQEIHSCRDMSHIEKTMNTLLTQINGKALETDPYTEQITEMQQQALQVVSYDHLNELTRVQDHQDFLLKLLTSKDSFVRKKIIEQNLSYLNQRLTHYLDRIGLPHTVKFMNDLTVSIEELGDVLWYVAVLAAEFKIPLSEVARVNADKLIDRASRGTLVGSGDNR